MRSFKEYEGQRCYRRGRRGEKFFLILAREMAGLPEVNYLLELAHKAGRVAGWPLSRIMTARNFAGRVRLRLRQTAWTCIAGS